MNFSEEIIKIEVKCPLGFFNESVTLIWYQTAARAFRIVSGVFVCFCPNYQIWGSQEF